ncbi:MmgE/PrpD family protein [Caballeronia calidae]|uniref:MmgE/PrpD family protein n=1 Tax=Caballeronia calidae TaxID=1777139 RepID=A0A158A7Y9_9BURK|nr:MmgE/PrpD family protein [Caballeronia calidae]SAK53928.1 MmgE/PrpD family protein [Caballeronia calidae]
MNVESNHLCKADPDFAEIYANFSASLEFSDIPGSVVSAARLNVFDTLACSIAGFQAPGVQEVLSIVREWGGKPEAAVFWTDLRVPAPQAAWINGIMSHACDYDDTHDKAILHGGISVLPAALAAVGVADHKVSGKEFYAAVVSGLELICRLGVATRIGLIQAGFIYSALFSYFAAAATAARVLRLSPEETLNAIGIAYSQAAGTHQVTRDGALTKRMQPGFGARAALTAVTMARKGVTGAQRIFEGEDGLGRTYLQSSLDPDTLRQGLGQRWHLEDLAYKPYPCCRMNHCAIDAALQVRAQAGFDWTKVTEIRVMVNSQGNQAVGVPLETRRSPSTVVQAQFSICYNIACALVNGKVGLSDFTAESLSRSDVLSVAARVTPIVDEEFERKFGRNVTPARVEAVCNGKVFTAQVEEAKGGSLSPMSNQDLRRKLEDCLSFGGFETSRASSFEESIAALENSADVASDISSLIASVLGR